ncbi:hypothetical protein RUND412_011146, partial [Rhizina undulata]
MTYYNRDVENRNVTENGKLHDRLKHFSHGNPNNLDVRLIPAGDMSQTTGAGSSPFQFDQLNLLREPEPVPVSCPEIAVNTNYTIPEDPSEMKSQPGHINSTECFHCPPVDSGLFALDTVESAMASQGNASQRSAAANNSDTIEVVAQISHVGLAQQARPGVPRSPIAEGGVVEAAYFTAQHTESLNNAPCPHAENNEGFKFTASSTQSTVGNIDGGNFTNSHSAPRQGSSCSHIHSLPANVEGYFAGPNPIAEAPCLAQPEVVYNVQPLNRPAKRLLPAQLAA